MDFLLRRPGPLLLDVCYELRESQRASGQLAVLHHKLQWPKLVVGRL